MDVDELRRATQDRLRGAGAGFLDMRSRVPQLEPRYYEDDVHVSPDGALLAQQRPQWQFLLVGHASADVTRLKSMKNVTFVGPQPYESLPGWAKAFDVAIIPYRQSQQVQNANPLKLREYLASGKPVVSVPTVEVEKFRDVLEIRPDREGFLAAIERSIATDSPEKRTARTHSVREMSWEHRVAQTLETVNALLQRDAQV